MAEPRSVPPVTVAVLNHRRPELLRRVLTGILQLDYPNFEIVVVTDQQDPRSAGLPEHLVQAARFIHFARPNICRARNIAIGHARGEIVAFIDDDAVPEPDWLAELVRPFSATDIATVAGAVRGENGLDLEWSGGLFDLSGQEQRFPTDGQVIVRPPQEQLATEQFLAVRGVNSAFLRHAVMAVGGFDESIHYYLDETDLAVRLVRAGWASAIAPLAEVHHGVAESAVRGRIRKPRNLFEIAASMAYFLRRHLPPQRVEPALDAFVKTKRDDLDQFIRLGLVRARECAALRQQLHDGTRDGLNRRALTPLTPHGTSGRLEPPPRSEPPGGLLRIAVISCWGMNILTSAGIAAALADQGHRVSRFSYFSGPGARHVVFENGVWVHRGGTWRPGRTSDGRLLISRRRRAEAEIARVMAHRRFDVILRPAPLRPRSLLARTGGGRPMIALPPPGTDRLSEAVIARLDRAFEIMAAPRPDAPSGQVQWSGRWRVTNRSMPIRHQLVYSHRTL